MLIRSITSSETRVIGGLRKVFKRTLNYGEFKGKHITVDNWINDKGETVDKRFVFWDDNSQIIVNKKRSNSGFNIVW